MTANSNTRGLRTLLAACLVALGSSGSLVADDTEIYQTAYDDVAGGSRPKVLILFDNSGSMGTLVPGQKPAYDPAATYVGLHNSDRIYWSTNGQPPSANSDSYYFSASKNRCAESITPLATVGYFQTKARRWETSGRDSWNNLSTSDKDPKHVDCLVDVINENNLNPGVDPNYPRAPATYNISFTGEEYSATTPAQSNIDWGSSAYTFYSAHYMDWYYDTTVGTPDRTRIDIAQEVVTNLINANTGVDFGLGVFNYNYPNSDPYHGGRIIRRIISGMSTTERGQLVNMVDGLINQTSTPLCELTWEAYSYIAGKPVQWGDNKRITDLPDRDTGAEIGTTKVYDSPSANCEYTYIILMTDGFPQNDFASNDAIKALTGDYSFCGPSVIIPPATAPAAGYPDFGGTLVENCLPRLTHYMATTDLDGDPDNGDQFGITYTIGFATDQQLLEDAATGTPQGYFTADSAAALAAAFREAILGILETDSTFNSPSVAVDSFKRTQSREEVYFSMFKPSEGVDWPGNIKKLRVGFVSGNLEVIDGNNPPNIAINATSNGILSNISTYWSSNDGGDVLKGGVGALLAARDPASRTILTNSGSSGALETFNEANLDAEAFGLDGEADPDLALLDEFGADDADEIEAAINWGWGYEFNKDSATNDERRDWILADMLHAQPLLVNYGALGSFTKANPDLRLVVGTNAGILHMFGNDDGEEDWAFFPKELVSVLKKRGQDVLSSQHVYGIDSTPTLYTRDLNKDGTINASAPGGGDKAWVYFGLRRGGRMLYALDISSPGSPSFMWHINELTAGFSELGQTWSEPVVRKIPGYYDTVDGYKVYRPVLIFGAGYDPSKDDPDNIAGDIDDTMGRGLYVVDAETGALVWSVTPAADSATNMQETGLEHAVAAPVTTLDSNGDDLVDRVYMADTGGNVWRVDLPGNVRPDGSQDTWHIFKLAAFNGGSSASDRRFFNAVDIVRTVCADQPFDAVLLGSGDRTNPRAVDVENHFYMVKDKQVSLYFDALDVSNDCNIVDQVDDNRCGPRRNGTPLVTGDLYDATDNLLQDGTDAEKLAAYTALQTKDGWLIKLLAQAGEKSTTRARVLYGKLRFGTFAPDQGAANLCVPTPGTGRNYTVNMCNATPPDPAGVIERDKITGTLIPDDPTLIIPEDGEIRLLSPLGIEETGEELKPPFGSYWYREEY